MAARVLPRVLLPLMFIGEGVSPRSYLLDLDGSEMLLVSHLLAGAKLHCFNSPVFLVAWALEVFAVSVLGGGGLVQYGLLLTSLSALHVASGAA